MKKGISLIVSSAMVFSMFATSVFAAEAPTTTAKYEELVKAGIFAGYPDGEAHLDETMTRAQAAVIIAKLAGYKEGVTSVDAGFTDVPAGHWAKPYVDYAAALGIISGVGAGKFDPKAEVTIQELAKLAVDALKAVKIELPAGTAVTGKVSDWAKDFVAAAVSAELIAAQEDYTVAASRELLVVATYSANEAIEEALNAPAAEAKAIGAKKIEVKFNTAIDDAKAVFTVKKGTITVAVATKTVAADKKSAVLELNNKLTDGEYTVTVTGLEKELSSKFTATNEKVSKIEYLTTVAPLVNLDGDALVDDIAVPYKVSNQYGEDVTRTTSLTSGGFTIDPVKGLVTMVGNYRVGDVVAVSLIHAETATSAVATLTVSAEAKTAELTVSGVYNKDNKTLNEDTNLALEGHYLLVDAKDQYGSVVKSTTKLDAEVIVNQSNSLVVTTVPGFTTVTVDGVERTALKLNGPLTVGQSIFTLISNTTGKNASTTVTVAEASRVETINLINPGFVSVGEEIYVPVEAFDKQGNLITNLTTLNNQTKGVRVSINGAVGYLNAPFVLKDSLIQIKIPAANTATAGWKSIIAMTASNKVVTINVEVKGSSVPTSIRGVDSDFRKAAFTSQVGKTIAHTNLVIEDQYGRVMSDSAVAAWILAGNSIKITEAVAGGAITLTDALIDGATVATYDTLAANATEKITLALSTDGGVTTIANSAADVTLRTTDGTEFVSYAVDALGTVYDTQVAGAPGAAYDKALVVNGVLSDGNKVVLPSTAYSAVALTNNIVNADIADNNAINTTTALVYPTDKTEIVVPITVTVHADAANPLTQDVTFSTVKSKVASVKLSDSAATHAAGAIFDINTLVIKAKDQYGVEVPAVAGVVTFADATSVVAPTVLITAVSGEVQVTGNGSASAAIVGASLAAGEQFDVKVTYVGGATATHRVTVI